MIESTFDPCLLYSTNQNFGVVGLQTDDTLIIADDDFADQEENELALAKLMSKKREKLTSTIPITFNGGVISLADDGNFILLTQPKQFDQIQLINVSSSVDLTSSRGEIRKLVTPKDQYVAQRARGA
jgi:hypothetical protein